MHVTLRAQMWCPGIQHKTRNARPAVTISSKDLRSLACYSSPCFDIWRGMDNGSILRKENSSHS